MHTLTLRDIAEVAGLLSVHSAHIVESRSEIAPRMLFDYTSASRRRSRLWWELLRKPCTDDEWNGRRQVLLSLAEEILVAELGARVGAAVLVANDARRGCTAAGPFGRHVLLDVLQAKHSVLTTLLEGVQPLGALLRLNRLRRRTEHWSDLLLAQSGLGGCGAEFACDRDRWQRFRDESSTGGGDSLTSQQLLLISLRQAMPASSVQAAEREQLHAGLIRPLLSLLPPDAFGMHGGLRTPWVRRISSGLAEDGPAARPRVRRLKHSAHSNLEILRRSFRRQDAGHDEPCDEA
jgi:hypothetical protein